jgi:ferredoxin
MCQRAGVRLTNLREAGFVETVCNGHFLEKVYLSKISLDADVIINLPKLKTHSLCVFTGGVKNMYGTIPSGHRTKFHGEYIRNEDFSQMLTDIFSAIRPQLTIMDGIIAMEGEGPAAGSLRRLGVILTSQDAVAVDAVATKIIGLNPLDIHTTRYSDERSLGVGNLENIEVVGERIESVVVPDFKPPSSAVNMLTRRVPRGLPRFILRQLSVKPSVIERLCSGCSECEKICPVGAISVSDETAKINPGICIQCMCCHEVCRFDAIVPKRSITGNTIQFLVNILRKLRATAG